MHRCLQQILHQHPNKEITKIDTNNTSQNRVTKEYLYNNHTVHKQTWQNLTMNSIKSELARTNATPTINRGMTYLKQEAYLNHISIDKIYFKRKLRGMASLLGGSAVLTEHRASQS